MITHPDFKELLKLFAENNVKYLIVGAYSVAYYGYVRSTGDLDIWLETTVSNSKNVIIALNKFGFSTSGLSEKDFQEPETVIQLGFPPYRIDLITSADGLNFDECYEKKTNYLIDGVPIYIISKNDLITNKHATGRTKDLLDLENLI